METPNKVTMENVQLVFRNFTGNETQMNSAGDRNFCVLLDEETAEKMLQDGWNVKRLRAEEQEVDSDEVSLGAPYIQVKVKYKIRPPRIFMITSVGKTALNEDTVGSLDWADILNCDLIIRPYEWEVRGKVGVAAYLQSMYVTIQEDELERKYGLMEQGQ